MNNIKKFSMAVIMASIFDIVTVIALSLAFLWCIHNINMFDILFFKLLLFGILLCAIIPQLINCIYKITDMVSCNVETAYIYVIKSSSITNLYGFYENYTTSDVFTKEKMNLIGYFRVGEMKCGNYYHVTYYKKSRLIISSELKYEQTMMDTFNI